MGDSESSDCIRNAQALTGHLQRKMMSRNHRLDNFNEDRAIKGRLDSFALRLVRRATLPDKTTVKREAYAWIRKQFIAEKERRKYRDYFNRSIVAFSRLKERGIQRSDPFGTVPFYMENR